MLPGSEGRPPRIRPRSPARRCPQIRHTSALTATPVDVDTPRRRPPCCRRAWSRSPGPPSHSPGSRSRGQALHEFAPDRDQRIKGRAGGALERRGNPRQRSARRERPTPVARPARRRPARAGPARPPRRPSRWSRRSRPCPPLTTRRFTPASSVMPAALSRSDSKATEVRSDRRQRQSAPSGAGAAAHEVEQLLDHAAGGRRRRR